MIGEKNNTEIDNNLPTLENNEVNDVGEKKEENTFVYENSYQQRANEQAFLKARFQKFNKSYKKAGLCVLLWFLLMNVICTLFIILGVFYAFFDYIIENEINIGSLISKGEVIDVIDLLSKSDKFVIIPIMYFIGDIVSGVISYFIARAIVYRKGFTKEEKRIRKLSFTEYFLYVLMAFGLWGVGVLAGNIREICGLEMQNINEVELLFGSNKLIYLFLAVILAPIFEELIFRKIFIDATVEYSEGLSVVVSALFFGLVHGNVGQFFLAFFLGLLLAKVYIKTRNIFYTMGIHLIINAWASVVDGASVFTSDSALETINAIWIIATVLIALIGFMIYFMNGDGVKELLSIDKRNEFNGVCVVNNITITILIVLFTILLGLTEANTIISFVRYALSTTFKIRYVLVIVPGLLFIYTMKLTIKEIKKKYPKRIS